MSNIITTIYSLIILYPLLMYPAAQEGSNSEPFNLASVSIELLKDHSHHVDALCRIWHDVLGKKSYPDFTQIQEPYTEVLRSQMQDDKLPVALIALIDNQPIGLCAIRPTCIPRKGIVPWSDEHPEAQPWLAVFVAAAYQNKGVGTNLVLAAINYAQQKFGFDRVYAVPEDTEVEALYMRKGCAKIADTTLRGKPAPVLCMELNKF